MQANKTILSVRSLIGLLVIGFAIVKLFGIITWSWWWMGVPLLVILAPLIVAFIVWLALLISINRSRKE